MGKRARRLAKQGGRDYAREVVRAQLSAREPRPPEVFERGGVRITPLDQRKFMDVFFEEIKRP